MASILMHSENVPSGARAALQAAHGGPPERRHSLLETAARILQDEAGVPCPDARELVDLPAGDCPR